MAPATPLGPYPWPGDPAPLLQRSCAIPTCAPRRGPGGRGCALWPAGHRLGPALAQLADFGTISASPEKSLTLRETTPPGMGRTTQEARTTAEEGGYKGRTEARTPCSQAQRPRPREPVPSRAEPTGGRNWAPALGQLCVEEGDIWARHLLPATRSLSGRGPVREVRKAIGSGREVVKQCDNQT